MATGSNGTLGKKSPASMHTSVIVLSLVLIFAIRNSALDVPLSLVLLVTAVMWAVQRQKAKSKRIKSSEHHESTSDEQNLGTLGPNPAKEMKVVERRPRSSADRDNSFSDSPDQALRGGPFAALTDALPSNGDQSGKHIEPARPQQHHPAPKLGHPQYQSRAPHPFPQDPGSVGLHNPESLPPEIAMPKIKPPATPASDVPALTPPTDVAMKATAPTPAVTQKAASTAAPAKIARDSRSDDNQGGSAAICVTHESATTSLHELREDNGSCLSTSSLFA